MKETIQIQNIKVYPAATVEQTKALMEDMVQNDSREILLVPAPDSKTLYAGFLLEKHYTSDITDCIYIRESQAQGAFRVFSLHRSNIRGFLHHLSLLMQESEPKHRTNPNASDPEPDLPLGNTSEFTPPPAPDPIIQFLMDHTPATIQQDLDAQILGQPDLTKAVADFLYYHALRQRHPDLPPRPLLIAGPSGSGKTEVWRVASKLYGNTFSILIADGSNLTCDGWAGSNKISTFVTTSIADGGILVVDEFDKLTRPKFSSGGENVALQMQSEFLKLIEGEQHITENRRRTNVTTRKMGFVMVGAFENLRSKPVKEDTPIGFRTAPLHPQKPHSCPAFTDEDFVAHGIMPELVGRIATKCTTQSLDENTYLRIIRGSHSRVAIIEQVLQQYGIQVSDVISNEELKEMIAKSLHNRTGVRWVSAQVENRLLESIREQGLYPDRQHNDRTYAHCS